MKSVLSFIRDAVEVTIASFLCAAVVWIFLYLAMNTGEGKIEHTAEVYATSAVPLPPEDPAEGGVGRFEIYVEGEGEPPEWYRPDEEMAAEWSADDRNQLYIDSRGAEAYGWEITEAMRLLMLETGGESDEDIRAHCEVIVKQLEYTQTVGGWDDWGTTLYGILHSHSYTQTNKRIWTEDAAPSERLREIFWDVWYNGYETDFRVQCFRSDRFHSWAIPAYQIGNTYYSINPWQDFSMFK